MSGPLRHRRGVWRRHSAPPLRVVLHYNQFATKTDVANLGIALRGDMGELRGDLRAEMGELRGELRAEMAQLRNDLGGEMRSTVKTIVFANLGTSLAVAGFVIGLS